MADTEEYYVFGNNLKEFLRPPFYHVLAPPLQISELLTDFSFDFTLKSSRLSQDFDVGVDSEDDLHVELQL